MAALEQIMARVSAAALALGPVRSRAMFGGHGIYLNDLMVALVAYDQLYLKVGPGNRADFEAAGLPPFTYTGKGRPVEMSYRLAPPDGDLSGWLAGALAAAVAAKASGPKRPKARRPQED